MLGSNRKIFTGGKFAAEAVFTLDYAAPATIRGVFDDAFYDAQLGENRLEGSIPRLTVTLDFAQTGILTKEGASIPFDTPGGIVRETPVTIDGKAFSVLEVQPDFGTGLAVIELAHEAPQDE